MSLKILIVEDNPSDACLIEHLLEDSETKFDFEVAESMTLAISLLNQNHYDLILSDLSLPETRGADTITKIREHNANSPIIVITGNESDSIAEATKAAGAQEFMLKGELRPDMLELIINDVVSEFAAPQN